MRLNGNQARAARASALREPIEYEIGGEVFVFAPEMSLDVLFGVDAWGMVSMEAMRLWMLAHMLADSGCDITCVDGDRPVLCDALKDFKQRLRKVRVDGLALDETDMTAMFAAVRDAQGVDDEGKSSSSADSSESAGDTSSETSSVSVTPLTSSPPARAASGG